MDSYWKIYANYENYNSFFEQVDIYNEKTLKKI